jgi:hypothetical protein
MITDMQTVWLYSFSPQKDVDSKVYYTVFCGTLLQSSRPVFATAALSYLANLSSGGAGVLIRRYSTYYTANVELGSDFKNNSVFIPDATSVTFAMNTSGAEAYAQCNCFFFG